MKSDIVKPMPPSHAALPRILVPAVGEDRRAGLIGSAEVCQARLRRREELRLADARAGGHGEREQHPGDGGVHVRLEHEHPEHHAKQRIRDSPPCPGTVEREEREEREEHQTGADEGRPADRTRVEERDHEHGAQVIGNGQRGEKDAQGWRRPVADRTLVFARWPIASSRRKNGRSARWKRSFANWKRDRVRNRVPCSPCALARVVVIRLTAVASLLRPAGPPGAHCLRPYRQRPHRTPHAQLRAERRVAP